MAAFLLLLAAIPIRARAHAVPDNRAKVVEEYVVSARLDENGDFPQLQRGSQSREVYLNDGPNGRSKAKHSSPSLTHPPFSIPNTPHADSDPAHRLIDDPEDVLQDRDLLLHHHPLPPPPHPHPPLVGLLNAPSLFAIGLITFLILLNSLQTSLLLVLKSKGSLLGSVTGGLGRRKRFAPEGAPPEPQPGFDAPPDLFACDE